jgi:hypothetical protein
LTRSQGAPPIVIALVTSSTGELHCLLPVLRLVRDKHPAAEIWVVFGDRSTRRKFEKDDIYKRILTDITVKILHKWALITLPFTSKRHRVRLIFKEFGPTPRNSVPSLLRSICPRSSLVLFPHAYTLHNSGTAQPAAASRSKRADYDQDAIDALLVGSQLDVDSWAEKLDRGKIQVVGATGYTVWWGDIIRQYAADSSLPATLRPYVFLTTRGPHDVYLTEDNYRYLVKNAVKTALSFADVTVVIKPHPREDPKQLASLVAEFPKDRVQFSPLNTLALASRAIVTVSFWSSALLDSLAAGTPAIEFHRYHHPIPQTVLDESGAVASIYTTLGLALKATTAEELAGALDVALFDRATLLENQRRALKACFPDDSAALDALTRLLENFMTRSRRPDSRQNAAAASLRLTCVALIDAVHQLTERAGNGH